MSQQPFDVFFFAVASERERERWVWPRTKTWWLFWARPTGYLFVCVTIHVWNIYLQLTLRYIILTTTSNVSKIRQIFYIWIVCVRYVLSSRSYVLARLLPHALRFFQWRNVAIPAKQREKAAPPQKPPRSAFSAFSGANVRCGADAMLPCRNSPMLSWIMY